jgi:spore germination protein YaaH
MGIIVPDCITTDASATTFYGFVFSDITNEPDSPSNRLLPWSTVFIKSNTNPASPKDLSWSVVSRIETAMLLGAELNFSGNDISCAISTQGVFTVLLHVDSKGGIGIRYDPAGTMDPKYNVKGAWINMVVDPKYLWTDDFKKQTLGYVSNGSTNVLVHVIFSETANMLNVAIVHDATNTVTGTGAWALVSDRMGIHIVYVPFAHPWL